MATSEVTTAMWARLEISEVVALVAVLMALVMTAIVWAHPANTPRTRRWWGRFLVLLVIETVSQIATNAEQVFPVDSTPYIALNTLEHVAAAGTGLWAAIMTWQGLAEAAERRGKTDEVVPQ